MLKQPMRENLLPNFQVLVIRKKKYCRHFTKKVLKYQKFQMNINSSKIVQIVQKLHHV